MTLFIELRCDAIRSLDCTERKGGAPNARGLSADRSIFEVMLEGRKNGWKHDGNGAYVCPACANFLNKNTEGGNASSDSA